MARKTFNEKLNDSKDMPKIIKVTDEMSVERYGGEDMLIAPPLEYNEIMAKIPEGKLITISEIREFGKTIRFNSLFNNIAIRQGIPEDKEDNIRLLLKYLMGVPDDLEIIQVPVKIVLSMDDSGHAIADHLEYYINGEKRVLRERVCPFCGAPLDHEAGAQPANARFRNVQLTN